MATITIKKTTEITPMYTTKNNILNITSISSDYNQDGSIHDKGKGDVTFSRKAIEWLNDHGGRIEKR
jgi:hypothetical protein